MKSIKIFILVILCLSFAFAQDESEIIEELQDIYENIDNFSAEFIQKEVFKLTGSKNQTTGKIYIQDGTKYRLETDDHTVVTDGKTVWSYSPHSNKVIIDNIKEGDASLLPRDMLFKYPQNYFSNLIKKEKVDDKEFYVIKMTPKEDIHGYVKSMKIWVDINSYLIHKIEYDDLNDNTSSFEIKKMDIKTELSSDLFSFKTDENIEIIDMRKN